MKKMTEDKYKPKHHDTITRNHHTPSSPVLFCYTSTISAIYCQPQEVTLLTLDKQLKRRKSTPQPHGPGLECLVGKDSLATCVGTSSVLKKKATRIFETTYMCLLLLLSSASRAECLASRSHSSAVVRLPCFLNFSFVWHLRLCLVSTIPCLASPFSTNPNRE